MTKILLILSLIGFQSFATTQSQEMTPKNLDLLCMTETPSTSFIGATDQGRFHVQLVNSFGVDNMPIHSGLVTIADVEQLKKRAEILKNVGDSAQFSFDLKNCTVYADKTFNCTQGSDFTGVNGEKIQAYGLSSTLSTMSFMGIKMSKTQIRLYLIIQNESHFVSMDYYSDSECKMESL